MALTQTLDRKGQIQAAAQNLFRERGFAATSMRDLAKAVGIEPASLYSHITSKESILREICFHMADQFFEQLDQIDGQANPAEQLKQAIIGHISVIRKNYDASAVFLHEWRFLEEPNLGRFKALRRDYEQRFRAILEEGQAAGLFRQMNMKIVLPTLFSSMNWAYEHVKPATLLPPEEVGETIWRLFVQGLEHK